MTPAKNTICLWYNGAAEEAARFYAATFPDSAVRAVHRAPSDYPSGKAGDVLVVDFTVLGLPCVGLNGGAHIKHSEAFSFQVSTADQAETDDHHRPSGGLRDSGGERHVVDGGCPAASGRCRQLRGWHEFGRNRCVCGPAELGQRCIDGESHDGDHRAAA